MAHVAIIGAGISGLATSAFLGGDEGPELTVFEASAQPGGNVRSVREDGRILDAAANGWLDNEPAVGRLLDRVGLSARTVKANDAFSTRWIFADGEMQAAPLGPMPMAKTALISLGAKLRVLAEPFLPRGPEARDPGPVDTESVGSFVERRLGPAFVERMVGPMIAGIYAADPYEVSLRAAIPRMHELEREYRSLFVAMARLRSGGQPSGHLTTLPGGAGELTEHLAERLGDRLHLARPVTALVPKGDAWQVRTDEGALEADAVILACPAYAQAELLGDLEPAAAAALDAIPYAPVAVVASAWGPGSWEREPTGFGVLAARDVDLDGVLGTLFTSCVFPDQAPEGEVLLRTIVGGSVYPDAAGVDDDELIRRARAAHEAFFGFEQAPPRAVRIFRHPRGIPHYEVGHLGRVAAATEAEQRQRGLFLAGNHLRGIGVKDCIREGERTAERVRSYLG